MVIDAPRILLADDEETFRLSTAALLEREGYQCDCAQDVEEAGRLLSNSYDLLISDIRMPGNGQLQFLRDIHARYPLLPILVVTGCPSIETATATLRLSFVDYLLKPIEWPELSQSIALALQRGQLARAVLNARASLSFQPPSPVTPGPVAGAQGLAWPLDRYVEEARRQIELVSRNVQHTVAGVMTGEQAAPVDVCRFMACPRQTAYKAALLDTVEVLERTKRAFKSKDLGELRRRLELLLNEPEG